MMSEVLPMLGRAEDDEVAALQAPEQSIHVDKPRRNPGDAASLLLGQFRPLDDIAQAVPHAAHRAGGTTGLGQPEQLPAGGVDDGVGVLRLVGGSRLQAQAVAQSHQLALQVGGADDLGQRLHVGCQTGVLEHGAEMRKQRVVGIERRVAHPLPQGDGVGVAPLVDQGLEPIEDGGMQRHVEMLGQQRALQVVVELVVDHDGAEQGLLGGNAVRRRDGKGLVGGRGGAHG
jgi:hypothetical protein